MPLKMQTASITPEVDLSDVVCRTIKALLDKLESSLLDIETKIGTVLIGNNVEAAVQVLGKFAAKSRSDPKAAGDMMKTWFQNASVVMNALTETIGTICSIRDLSKVRQQQVAKLAEDGNTDCAQLDGFLEQLEKCAQKVSQHLYDIYDIVPAFCQVWNIAKHSELEKSLVGVRSEVTTQLVNLARATFMVTKEPLVKRKQGFDSYQMITFGNKIRCEVKLLAGFRGSGKSDMKVRPFVVRDGKLDQDIAVSTKPGTVMLELPKANRDGREATTCTLTATFDSLQCDFVKDKKRRDVADMKYSLAFLCNVTINEQTLSFFCKSLPLVMIVNVSQECESRSTLFWDNAFSRLQVGETCSCVTREHNLHYCRKDFKVPEAVPWPVFYSELALWFESLTECKLLMSHQEFIRRCVCDPKSKLVTFFRFCREIPKDIVRDESQEAPKEALRVKFWSWIFGIKKFVKENLYVKFMWQHGLLYGFATEGEARLVMRTNCTKPLTSTMMLRFCNRSEKGALVVMQGFQKPVHNGYVASVRSLKPWESEELAKSDMDLFEKLKLKACRQYIHPDIDWLSVCANYSRPMKPAPRDEFTDPDDEEHYTEPTDSPAPFDPSQLVSPEGSPLEPTFVPFAVQPGLPLLAHQNPGGFYPNCINNLNGPSFDADCCKFDPATRESCLSPSISVPLQIPPCQNSFTPFLADSLNLMECAGMQPFMANTACDQNMEPQASIVMSLSLRDYSGSAALDDIQVSWMDSSK